MSNLKSQAQSIGKKLGKLAKELEIPYPKILTDFLLGDGVLSWKVYPVETTVSEKLHALIVRGSESSCSKDIFDLNLLLKKCDADNLKLALIETFKYRGDLLPESIVEYIKETDCKLLKMGWKSAVNDIPGEPDFDTEFNGLIKQLKFIFK